MRWWKRLLSGIGVLALAACAHEPDALSIASASVAGNDLVARLDWQPNDNLLEALDHGIPLDFVFTLKAQKPLAFGLHVDAAEQHRHIQLRYFPLSRYYQLLDLDRHQSRGFPARASALAAFEDIRIPLAEWNAIEADRYRLDVAIDRKTLPGVLRVSSLVRPAWWLHSEAYTWPAAAN
jgi:hypothetical protein